MLAHYAGSDVNVDDLMKNNFSRAGTFIPPEPKQEPKADVAPAAQNKAKPRRVFSEANPAKTSNPTRPVAKPTVALNVKGGNINSAIAHKMATELAAMPASERAALIAGVRVAA